MAKLAMKSLNQIWQHVILTSDAKVKEVVHKLNQISIKIVFITNKEGRLEGSVTDGDVRRGLISGYSLDSPISSIAHQHPIKVTPEIGREEVMRLMEINKINHIPIVNNQHQIVGLHSWDEISEPLKRSNLMIIMAGGLGTRLRPHTENCPKPMLKISGRPILEHIIERAKSEGFNNFIISVNYLGHMIESYFGNGDSMGVEIKYLREEAPLGTAGALSLMKTLPGAPFIVTNGDVIADISYGKLLDFHVRNDALATMAVRIHKWQHPYGLVKTKGIEIIDFEEKPTYQDYINAGVYALDPIILGNLKAGEYCDMPNLFLNSLEQPKKVIAFPLHELWMDIGREEDLLAARNVF